MTPNTDWTETVVLGIHGVGNQEPGFVAVELKRGLSDLSGRVRVEEFNWNQYVPQPAAAGRLRWDQLSSIAAAIGKGARSRARPADAAGTKAMAANRTLLDCFELSVAVCWFLPMVILAGSVASRMSGLAAESVGMIERLVLQSRIVSFCSFTVVASFCDGLMSSSPGRPRQRLLDGSQSWPDDGDEQASHFGFGQWDQVF